MAKIIRFEELIIGGLLKLGSLDQVDITILKEWLYKNHDIVVIDGVIFFNEKYIDHSPLVEGVNQWSADKFFLNPEYSFDTNVSTIEGKEFTLRQLLEFTQGPTISSCFATLDLNTFMLRKIKMLSPLTEEHSLLKNFSERQINIIENLQRNGYLDYAWNDDEVAPYDSFCQLRITKLGEARIFMDDNQPEIDDFCKRLNMADHDILERFIGTMDLNGWIADILNVTAFNNFCGTYDISPATEENDLPNLSLNNEKQTVANYISLPDTFLNEKGGLLQRLLTIKDGHLLYVTHPNSLFDPKLILNGDELKSICWESIDPKAMLRYYEPKSYDAKKSHNAIGCIHTLIGSKCQDGKNKYLVILESYLDKSEERYLVRGIFRVIGKSCSIALNPEFEGYVLTESSPGDEQPTQEKKHTLNS